MKLLQALAGLSNLRVLRVNGFYPAGSDDDTVLVPLTALFMLSELEVSSAGNIKNRLQVRSSLCACCACGYVVSAWGRLLHACGRRSR